jgi:hypothetical protein
MRRGRRAMERWRVEAWPILTRVMDAEDRLIAGSEGPAVMVNASCDQLDAAVSHAQWWLDRHRCPDTKFGLYVSELISASRGMWAIMQMIAREAPDGGWMNDRDLTDKVGTNLLDRIQQASTARIFLRGWAPL